MAVTTPPYTPEFNPIEKMFRDIKAKLKKFMTPEM